MILSKVVGIIGAINCGIVVGTGLDSTLYGLAAFWALFSILCGLFAISESIDENGRRTE